jgi:hypothetical protein
VVVVVMMMVVVMMVVMMTMLVDADEAVVVGVVVLLVGRLLLRGETGVLPSEDRLLESVQAVSDGDDRYPPNDRYEGPHCVLLCVCVCIDMRVLVVGEKVFF